MSRRTPSKRGAPPMSPTRITRLEEKQQLQHLNARLEHYINKQREKDANQGVLQREVEVLREQHAEEIKNINEDWSERLSEMRAERDSMATKHAQLEQETNRLKKANEDLHDQVEGLYEQTDRFKIKAEELTKAKAELEVQQLHASDELATLRQEVEKLRRQNKHYEDDITSERDASSDATKRASEAESRVVALEDELNLERSQHERVVARLRDEVNELTSKNVHVEETTREEFASQLSDILADRQEQYEQEKNDALDALKEVYDEKLEAYRDHLERAGHELAEMKTRLSEAEHTEKQVLSERSEMTNIKVALEQRIEELEEQIKTTEERPSSEIAQLKEIIRRIKASFKRKDREFDELMDVKIALALEIKNYKQMLDREEERLGYRPGKKRKRNYDDDGIADENEDTDSLVFSGGDVHGEYITIRNSSTEAEALKGWSIQSAENKIEFEFTGDITLQPGESIKVWTGPGASEKEAENEANNETTYSVAWNSEEPVWSEIGDIAYLVNPDNELIAERRIVATNPIMDGSEDNKGQDSCMIM